MPKTILFCLLAFSLSSSLSATFVSWVGGNGDWDTASNWSTGTVPNSNNEVRIQCNCTVTISAGTRRARQVIIFQDSRLEVLAGGWLYLRPAQSFGLKNSGTFHVYGRLDVRESEIIDYGLLNYGTMHFATDSDININCSNYGVVSFGQITNGGNLGVRDYLAPITTGIHIAGNGRLTNLATGNIYVTDSDYVGISLQSDASLYSYGEITIGSWVTGEGVHNDGYFRNDGELNISNVADVGFRNTNYFYNNGLLKYSITQTGTALYNNGGTIINGANGVMDMTGFNLEAAIEFYGVNSSFTNYGLIDIFSTEASNHIIYFHWYTSLRNYPGGEINVNCNSNVAVEFNGSQLYNQGADFLINTNAENALGLRIGEGNSVINYGCGTMIIKDRISIGNYASLSNRAWLELPDYAPAPMMLQTSKLDNQGVIYDPHNQLANTPFGNVRGIIIRPFNQLIEADTPYENAFVMGSNTNAAVDQEVFGGDLNTLVGTFDNNRNSFVVDAETYEHYDSYFINFALPGSCATRIYEIPYEGPYYFNGPGSNNTKTTAVKLSKQISQLSVFPNPATGHIKITLPDYLIGQLKVEVYSLNGQRLLRESHASTAGNIRLERPHNSPAGIYLLSVTDEAGHREQLKVTFAGSF